MRKSIVIAVSLLFVVASAFAQQHATPANTVSVFVSNLTVAYSSVSGSSIDATYGAAFDHMFTNHVSGELSVTSQRVRRSVSTFGPAGQPVYASFTDTLYPVDANVSYHFFSNSRWKPYVGAGVRYVSGTERNFSQLNSFRVSTHSIDPEISGGVMFQFRPTLGLRFDAKQVIGNGGSVAGDAAFTGSVGLSFRF
jgi:outer membrane autotransporter protein